MSKPGPTRTMKGMGGAPQPSPRPDGAPRAGSTRPEPRAGSVFLVIIGLLSVMLLLAMGLSQRFSGQARQMVVADQSTIARYFLESYASDILWQIRRQQNQEGSSVFKAFRSGTSVPLCEFTYRPSSPIADLAAKLGITLGPDKPVAFFEKVEALTYPPAAFRQEAPNEEKRGLLGILCQITLDKKQYSLELRYPFKVVLQTTPILRKFLMFFDQLHLEQASPFGDQDRLNVVPIRFNIPQDNRAPLSLYGWDMKDREKNGYIFLGSDEKKIFLNLVGGAYDENAPQLGLEDLWQISPSAFDVTSGFKEFGEEALLNDNEGKPVVVRGAGIPLAWQGHFSRFGLLGFSEEVAGSELLGDFRIDKFLQDDPSFGELTRTPDSLRKASVLRLLGNRLRDDFTGFEREIFGNIYARFFLLSFFEAPSVGSPIAFSPNPEQDLSFDQYGNAQMITFKPVRGKYCNYMSRIVSGGKPVPSLGDEASVPVYRDPAMKHKVLRASEFRACDGLRPAGAFTGLGEAWFANGPYDGPGGRPRDNRENALGRVTRYFKTAKDFRKAVGLEGTPKKKCWIDGVVYVHEPLNLPEGITTDDIRGGVVLVRGGITLGDVTRGEPGKGIPKNLKNLTLDKMLTFVSLTGDKITLTGNRYLGVQLFSLRNGLSGPVEQLGFTKGADFIFIGGMGVSTPQLERISRQLIQRGLNPMINFLPTLTNPQASYSVRINDRIQEYEFSAQ